VVACLVVGDSIAVGVAQYRLDCVAIAKTGITSGRYVRTLLKPATAGTVVISLGVNDDDASDTLDNLREVRRTIRGQTVYWLLPGIRPHAQSAIRTVAHEFGDRLIDTKPLAGPDHLHPTGAGYHWLAAQTLADIPPHARQMPLRTATPATPQTLPVVSHPSKG
jgi:lysophospholipase L1-like esterase